MKEMPSEGQDHRGEGRLLRDLIESRILLVRMCLLSFLWTNTIAAIPAVLVGGEGEVCDGCGVKNTPENLRSEYIHICCTDSSRLIFLLGC